MKKSFLFLIIMSAAFSIFSQTDFEKRTLYLKSPAMHGEDVQYIQGKLLEMGFTEIKKADGKYNSKTEEAVVLFQCLAGFNPNGMISSQEYEFFEKNDSRNIMGAIFVYNKYKEAKRLCKQMDYNYAKFRGLQTLSIFTQDNKTAYCNLEETHTDYLGDFNLFKVNETAYILVSREMYPDIPDGANPWERARFDDIVKIEAKYYINGVLYEIKNGTLIKLEDKDILKFIKDCIQYF